MDSSPRPRSFKSIASLAEPRSCHAPALQTRPDGILDEWFHTRQIHESQDAILVNWGLEGVTHVWVYDAGADFLREQGADPLTPADGEAFDRLLEDDLVLVESLGTAYALYELPDV
jgi:hypothetical protein